MFLDRIDAGKRLAEKLLKFKDKNPVVLALPRGGVVLGYEIAKVLDAPLNVIVVRKLGVPMQPEFGVGAIAEEDVMVLDESAIERLRLSEVDLTPVIQRERKELKRRIKKYRDKKLFLPPSAVVILVDDGMATGVTAKAAIQFLKKKKVKKIILAVPVCAKDTACEIKKLVDRFVCLMQPSNLGSIGECYSSFDQVSDEEVVSILASSN